MKDENPRAAESSVRGYRMDLDYTLHRMPLLYEGNRLGTLRRLALWLRGRLVSDARPYSEEDVQRFLGEVNPQRCCPPLSEEKLAEIVKEAFTAQPRRSRENATRYTTEAGCMCQIKTDQRSGASYTEELANFTATIVEEIVYDDGQEQRRVYHIVGKHESGVEFRRAVVPAEKFDSLSWVGPWWGSKARVTASQSGRAHLANAISFLSAEDCIERTVFTKSGWENLGGIWHYLHAGGAIGPNGTQKLVEVQLPERLGNIRLPDPPARESDELRDAVRASLSVLSIAEKPNVGALVLASAYRAMLAEISPVRFAVWIAGESGAYKTSLTALAQAHYGSVFTGDSLPANWGSTINSVERLSFLAKDAILTVDNFVPRGTGNEVAQLHSQVGRFILALGDQAGRMRMNQDGSLRRTFYPRGLVLSSGEEIPRGPSVKGRLFLIQIPKALVQLPKLSEAQSLAREGKFALAMSGFARWLAPRMDELKKTLLTQLESRRDAAQSLGQEGHSRAPDALASIFAGWDLFLRYAEEDARLPQDEAQALRERVWNALVATLHEQAQTVREEDPCVRAADLLRGALSGGYCHLTEIDGKPPLNPQAWGWAMTPRVSMAPDAPTLETWAPRGMHLGFIRGKRPDRVYLNPENAYLIVQKMAREQGNSFTVEAKTLWSRMRERNWLAEYERNRGDGGPRNLARRSFDGHSGTFLVLYSEHLGGPKASAAQVDLDEFPDDADDREPDTTHPGASAAAVSDAPEDVVLAIVTMLEAKAGAEVERGDVLALATERGLSYDVATRALAQLQVDGRLVQTRPGFYQARKVKWS